MTAVSDYQIYLSVWNLFLCVKLPCYVTPSMWCGCLSVTPESWNCPKNLCCLPPILSKIAVSDEDVQSTLSPLIPRLSFMSLCRYFAQVTAIVAFVAILIAFYFIIIRAEQVELFEWHLNVRMKWKRDMLALWPSGMIIHDHNRYCAQSCADLWGKCCVIHTLVCL